ncbi:MAG: type II TA system antitoxin MqsA family protein [Desulfomonilaceae bacterium]
MELCNVRHAAIQRWKKKIKMRHFLTAVKSVTVENLRGEFCPACGEGVWDSESNRRLDEAQTALMNAVRAEASADIRRIRKSLKLTQAELAKNFGLGPLAFSRYERGKTQPPILLVKVLWLLKKHPYLFEELREMNVPPRDVPTVAGNAARRKCMAV